MQLRRFFWLPAALACLAGCGRDPGAGAPVRPRGQAVTVTVPLGLPPVPVPEGYPVTVEAVTLGSRLFFSPALSADGSVTCASCHIPEKAFADGRATAVGIGGQTGKRNTPTLLNAVYQPTQFWDGRAATLEEQAQGPMMNPVEMGHKLASGVEERVAAEESLRPLFAAAFGPGPVTMDKITRAIAAFERRLVSGNSAFDRYEYGRNPTALTPSARRGLALFRDPRRANCASCHTIGQQTALFSDGLFHNLGAGMNAEGEIPDPGRYAVTHQERDRGAFRTPSLREVARTAPYMHDGSLKTLKEVVDFYVGGGNANPNRDPGIRPLTALSAQDRADLVAFLESLSGETPR